MSTSRLRDIALPISMLFDTPSCPRYSRRIRYGSANLALTFSSRYLSKPSTCLSPLFTPHMKITCDSLKEMFMPRTPHHGHFFHCFPNLFFILFPSWALPALIWLRVLLSIESFTLLCYRTQLLSCGIEFKEEFDCLACSTSKASTSRIAFLSPLIVIPLMGSSIDSLISMISFIHGSSLVASNISCTYSLMISSFFLLIIFQNI